ncbi:MAG: hypothetical protein ACYC6A_00745 [Armatimonadota bacterium]
MRCLFHHDFELFGITGSMLVLHCRRCAFEKMIPMPSTPKPQPADDGRAVVQIGITQEGKLAGFALLKRGSLSEEVAESIRNAIAGYDTQKFVVFDNTPDIRFEFIAAADLVHVSED